MPAARMILGCRLHSLAVALVIAVGQAVAQEESISLVSSSSLPEGNGLSSTFVADAGLSDHPDVLFADDFETGPLRGRWDEANDRDGKALSWLDVADKTSPLGERALRVTATLGTNTGGGLTKWFESDQTIFIRFYTRFAPDCDYVHHFCTLRANKSLQGGDRWSGFGGAGKLPDGQQRFSTAIEPWGNWGKNPPPGRWNFYSYWQDMKGSPDGKYWGNAFRPGSQDDIQRGRWICVEMMLRHNMPGQTDGEQAFWIDGNLRGHWKGYRWRSSPTLWANAFTLESYVTDRWTRQRTNVVDFDNVVIAKRYIGPAGRSPKRADSEADRSAAETPR